MKTPITTSYTVLFDLDETLVNCKSLFEAYKRYCLNNYSDQTLGLQQYNIVMKEINSMQQQGIERSLLNKYFYHNFKGVGQAHMRCVIKDWFRRERNKKDFFNSAVLDELERHQANDATILIVTGCFYDCASTIADYLNIVHVICNQLIVVDGFYTGEIAGDPIIGENKVVAVKQYLNAHDLLPECRYVYSDHISDLALLRLAQHPIVVGDSAELTAVAKRNNWKVI